MGLFDRFKYSAVIDSHTSEICRRLNGIILPINDSLWRQNTPPNHFNCFPEGTKILTPSGLSLIHI